MTGGTRTRYVQYVKRQGLKIAQESREAIGIEKWQHESEVRFVSVRIVVRGLA